MSGQSRFRDAVAAVTCSISAGAACAADLSVVPLWDGETNAPITSEVTNRFGGTLLQNGVTVQRVTDGVLSGAGAFEVKTLNPIPVGGSVFFQTALVPNGPLPAGRDLARYEALSFAVKNTTGAPLTLGVEIKDYRDSNQHRATQDVAVSAVGGWQSLNIPLDLGAAGWSVAGSPDLERSGRVSYLLRANQGATVSGSLLFDDVALIEPGGSLNPATATTVQLAERLARRQFDALWSTRNRQNGLLPVSSTVGTTAALNTTSAMLKMLPGAVDRGWVGATAADQYVATLATTLDTAMNQTSYLPPRYMRWDTLTPLLAGEESSVDAAFMALALHQYRSRPQIPVALRDQIDAVQQRFDFSAFSDTTGPDTGWKLAYHPASGFSSGTYNGYSGEPWLISLAAHLSADHHVPIETHYHSAQLRTLDHLVDPDDAHAVHSLSQWRAPFLQWLMPLFVDVSDRGADTYPLVSLATNPYDNAVLYQREVAAKLAELGRDDFAQPDAGGDGTGTYYRQFSLYDNHDRPDLYMPWSVALMLLGDEAAADGALRAQIEAGLHGPFGLSDSAVWATGVESPSQQTAYHDLWNTALSTMALIEYLYGDAADFAALSDVRAALDRVFLEPGDLDRDGGLAAADIDALMLHLRQGGDNPYFDLDNDGTVDGTDAEVWVEDLAGTRHGDADLDGTIAQADLDAVLLNWGSTVAGWAEGDFDGDGAVGQADLDAVLLNWGFAAQPGSVEEGLFAPEPAAGGILMLAACVSWRRAEAYHKPLDIVGRLDRI